MDKQRAISYLDEAIAESQAISKLGYKADGFERWKRNTLVAIKNIFEGDESYTKEFSDINYTPMVFSAYGYVDWEAPFQSGIKSAQDLLVSMIDEIEKYWNNEPIMEAPASANIKKLFSDRIFIVHGHDDAVTESVARVITQLGLVPIILSEQSNRGKTVIEKFEDNSNDVGFAVIIMTADDVGAAKAESNHLKPRARQNVVLELGYFAAKLQRKNLVVLLEEGIEQPSDIAGVVYTPLDARKAWRYDLTKELKAAGYQVSLDDL